MNYYVTIFQSVAPIAVLEKSGEFKELGNREPKDINELKVFPNYLQAKKSVEGKIITYKDKKFKAFSSDGSISAPYIHIESYRIRKPSKSFFTKEDVRKVISMGNDQYNNKLVVDEDGNVLLAQDQIVKEGFVVLNGDTFIAGNDYVGLEASKDDEFIENEYERLLSAWELHLESGGKSISARDYYQEINVEDTITNIKKILVEQYV